MFNLTYSKPYKGKVKHIEFKRNPGYYGIGNYQDINDVLWDVWGIIEDRVIARPVDNSSLYRTDSSAIYEGYNIEYLPYTFSYVGQKNKIKEHNVDKIDQHGVM